MTQGLEQRAVCDVVEVLVRPQDDLDVPVRLLQHGQVEHRVLERVQETHVQVVQVHLSGCSLATVEAVRNVIRTNQGRVHTCITRYLAAQG